MTDTNPNPTPNHNPANYKCHYHEDAKHNGVECTETVQLALVILSCWGDFEFLCSAYNTHKILHSLVILGPIWVQLESLSSECKAQRCGMVNNCMAGTGHLAI